MKNKSGQALLAVLIITLIIVGAIVAYFYFNLPKPCTDCLVELPKGYEDLGAAVVYRDLAYSTYGASTSLDLYIPKEYSARMPVIVYIHGGAFKAGDKNPALYVKQFTDA